MQRTEVNDPRLQRFAKRPVPFLLDVTRIFATHAQTQNLPGRPIHAGSNLDVELFPVTVANVFEQQNLSPIVRQASILKTHQWHQFSVFIDALPPSVQLASSFEVVNERSEIAIVRVC
jgi:hypothetical protein